jgi:hypothetical protein
MMMDIESVQPAINKARPAGVRANNQILTGLPGVLSGMSQGSRIGEPEVFFLYLVACIQ